MESPVVVDKPPEYHGKDDRGFPFEEEEGSGSASGAWSELAARHPDIAARLRNHPASWPRKRRPSNQDTEDFGDSFGGFDRFPFDDIPPEFREHFPSHWNRRFGQREEAPQPSQSHQPQPHTPPHQQTTATQTEYEPPPQTQQSLPQYGLRNTVDLGQKSAVDPSLVDAEERSQRSMSAPPEGHTPKMSHQESAPQANPPQPSKVRHIPIHVEGRDGPVINSDHTDSGSKPGYSHPHPHSPPEPTYFPDNMHYVPPPHMSRAFGGPYKNFRQGQPFAQQKVYPQTSAFPRGASPQRSQSPKPHEEYIEVPVHHEKGGHKPQQQQKPQPKPQHQQPPPQQQQPQPKQHQPPPQPQQPPSPPRQPTPPPNNDPITQILGIQTDVLKLMTEVENFTGTKKDKRYIYLDEMLTRNLIKLDNIETDGKENIRNARKEAIKCIQKCIAVLEAKAEKGSIAAQTDENKGTDGQMNTEEREKANENGEAEMTEQPKESRPESTEEKPEEPTDSESQANDTRPPQNTENKEKPDVDKKTKTNKRDKSKDKAPKNEVKETIQPMQVDDKVDKADGQAMEVDGAASQ